MVARSLKPKGLRTRRSIEDAARKLFAENGFHETTLLEITARANRTPAVFYRYYRDKQHLLAALADAFLDDVLIPCGQFVRLPRSADDTETFEFMVTSYWDVFKPHIGILTGVTQLASTQPKFAQTQARLRQFSIDVVTATIEHAQQQGFAGELRAEDAAAAIAALFERFTTNVLTPDRANRGPQISDDNAIATLSTIWKKTLYGFY